MESAGFWSPYLVGALIGALTASALYFPKEPIGASSFYATVAGYLGLALNPARTRALAYFKENPPKIGWEFVFVLSIIAGSAAAAASGGQLHLRGLPEMWTDRYGRDSLGLFAAVAFCGGALMAFGARLAGGCTSGHGITGTAQMSLSSWVSVASFFASGVLAVRLIY